MPIPAAIRILLASWLAAALPLAAQSAATPTNSGPIRVAVYADAGSPRTPRDMNRVLGSDPSQFSVRYLSADDIKAGGLAYFQVLVQGGGDSRIQSHELKERGRDAIRTFIHNGGGYVGICAGAHFTIPGEDIKLGILNARVVDNEHWARGRGNVVLDFTPAGQQLLDQSQPKTTVMYHQGPLLQPGNHKDLPPYTLLATYETEVAKNGAPHGVMQGTAAIVSAPYGNGRVLVFSPHPEQTKGQEHLVREAILWAAGRSSILSSASAPPHSSVPLDKSSAADTPRTSDH